MSNPPLPAEGVWAEARIVPFPASISEQARTALAAAVGPDGRLLARPPLPPAEDLAAWTAVQAAFEQLMIQRFAAIPRSSTAALRDVDGVPVYVVTPDNLPSSREGYVCLDIHGGALVYGGGEACKMFGQMIAEGFQTCTYSVDYRLAPQFPYPAALDDCLAVYKHLLEVCPPEKIAVAGGSAGGNLATALMLRVRDESLPLPALLVLMTPEVDLTESGDSFEVNRDADVTLRPLLEINKMYAGGEALTHPYVSPLFGEFTGFPPTYIQSGTRDLFLSNAARLHQALLQANVDAELHIFEARPHAGFGGAPEDLQARASAARFFAKHWPI